MKNSTLFSIQGFFLAICLIFGLSNSLFAQDADFVATPSTVSVSPNSPNNTFSVVIQVQINSGEIDAAEIHLDFDPTVLQVNALSNLGDAQLGIPVLSNIFEEQVDNVNGKIDLAYGNLFGANPTNSFDFIQIDFEAIAEGETSIDHSYAIADFRESKITTGGVNVLGIANDIPVEVAFPNEDPVASFMASPTSGNAELLVSVDASASTDDGTIETYDWNFGDGNTATGITASNNYQNQGNYTITLTVTDDNGATDSATENIVVNEVVITTYTITATADDNGSIDPPTASYSAGTSQTFTITPDSGYEINEVIVANSLGVTNVTADLVASNDVFTYELVDIQENTTITASFNEIPPFQLCIAAGSPALTAFGKAFEQDNATTGAAAHPTRTNGKKFANYSGPISGTAPGSPEELLFQKEIYGGAGGNNPSFAYDIPVENGFYKVELYFAEVFHSETGKRVFDVLLEDNVILDEYEIVDPIKDGISTFQTAITRTYYVNVQDGSLQVGIGPAAVDNGKISGLCVTAVDNANVHPITSIGALSFEALTAVAQPLNIIDADGDELAITFSGMPVSLTYNGSNNQLEGTPTVAEVGTYTINAIISDGTNAAVTEEFELVINPPVGDDPPTIVAISDMEISEGGTVSISVQVNDDNTADPTASIIIYDKSVPGGTNAPYTPAAIVPETDYTFIPTGGGSYALTWNTDNTDGRSYEARVTGSDGNFTTESNFTIDVAQDIAEIIPARTFSAPLPWYGGNPAGDAGEDFSVSIEATPDQNLGWINSGDFVEYLVEVPVAGIYDVEFLVGKGNAGPHTISLSEENGGGFGVLGSVDVPLVPGSDPWQTYLPYTIQANLTNAGVQTIRLDFSGAGGVNIKEFKFTPAGNFAPAITLDDTAVVAEGGTVNVPLSISDLEGDNITVTITSVSTEPNELQSNNGQNGKGVEPYPFNASAFLNETITTDVPGEYTSTLAFSPTFGDGGSDGDGNGVYTISVMADDGNNSITKELSLTVNDINQPITELGTTQFEAESYDDQGNSGGGDGIGVEIDGTGFVVGYTTNNDFAEYKIDVETAGSYQIDFFVGVPGDAGTPSGKTTTVSSNGNSVGIFEPVGTGGFGVFATQSVTVSLPAGPQTLRFDFNGSGFHYNLDYFSFIFQGAPDFPPTIDAIVDVEISEGETVSVEIQVNDEDLDTLDTTIIIYDKSVPEGSNNPFTPIGVVDASSYTFIENGNGTGNYTLTWQTDTTDGRSYEARVMADDGENSPVEGRFTIDVAQAIPGVIFARTFTDPLPWYSSQALAPFTVTIEDAGNIGWNNIGDFTEYLIDVPFAGTYDLRVNAAKGTNEGGNPATLTISEANNGSFSEIGTLSISNNGWPNYSNYTTTVTFSNAGVQKLKLDFGGSMNITELEFTEVVNAIPVVTVTAPTDNINVSRGADVILTGTAIDAEDGEISESVAWSSSDIQFASTPTNGIGASITAQFVTSGSQTVRASISDSGGETAFDEITVNVAGPQVNITSPSDNDVVASTDVTLEWSSTDVLFGLTEHFHIFVNPADVNNINTDNRISTAPQIGQEFWDLTSVEGIVEGENTIVIRVANQFHEEFTNPEAQDIVTFTVCSTEITSVTPTDPTTCGGTEGELVIIATGTNLEYSITDGDSFQSSASFTGLTAGTYDIVVREMGTTNCSATDTVTLDDPTGPTPIITGPLTYLEGSGGVTLDAGEGFATYLWSPGNETTQTITVLAGTYSVTVTDENGCDGTSIGVIVTEDDDVTPPTAICQDVTVQLDAFGNGSITAAEVDNGSNDVSGIASLSLNIDTFTCADLGTNQVMLIVVDNNGNQSMCTASVTVVDEVDPTFICPTDINLVISGPEVLTINTPTVSDNCDTNIVANFVRSDGELTLDAPFMPGDHTIVWTAIDVSGNMAMCTQEINLDMALSMANDILAFSVPGQVGDEVIDAVNRTVDLTVEFGTNVTDLVPNIQFSSSASISPNTGVAQDFSMPRMYTVTAENNDQVQWTVTVTPEADMVAPSLVSLDPIDGAVDVPVDKVIIITFDEPIQSSGGGSAFTFFASGTDLGSFVPQEDEYRFEGNQLIIDLADDFPLGGEYELIGGIQDLSGNAAVFEFSFKIITDSTPPEITCPTDIVVGNDLGECGALVTYEVTSDGSLSMTSGLASGTMFPIGTTMVTYQAADGNGNTASCSFDVTVNDSELPTISCVSDITVQAPMGNSFAEVAYAAPVFGDNCSGATIVQTAGLASGAEFPAGTTINTFEVTDAFGNMATCSFNVTVESGTIGETQLTVLDARTDTPLFDLVDGLVIQKSEIGTIPLGVIFNTDFNPNGVFFSLTGPLTENRSEGPAPHSLFGDIGINIQGKPFPIGNYTLVADPVSGSTITVNFSVVDAPQVCANFNAVIGSSSNPTQCGGSNGNIAVNVSNALSPVTYVWSHDANLNSGTATNLSAGTYSVTVTDANGCSKVLTRVLGNPASPNVTLAAFANVLDTASSFTLSGGSPSGGTYSGTGVTNNMFDPSAVGAGVYTITYSYTNPITTCMGTATRTLRVTSTAVGNSQLTVLDARTDTPLFDLVDGLVIQKSEIGTIPLGVVFNTDFNPGSVFFALTGPLNERRSEGPEPHSLFGDIGVDIQGKPFPVGEYTLIATPASGPTITVNFSVVDVPQVCANFNAAIESSSNPTQCGGSNGSITVNLSNALSPVTYVWSHDANLNSGTATDLSAGTYSVTVRDANGCSKVLTRVLSNPASPNVTLASFASVMDTDIPVSLSGGLPVGGTYSGIGVTNGSFDPSLGAGTYTITYSFTDALTGCSGSASANITVTTINTALSVTSFTLINADNDMDLMTLTDGMEIDIDDLPTTNLDIRANTTADVESVRMTLSGALSRGWTENTAPYALFGNIGTDYLGGEFIAGGYSVAATPYPLNGLGGTAGTVLTINFQIISGGSTFFLKKVDELQISPNPADEVITIVFDKPVQVSTIFVYDAMGRLVKTYKGSSLEAVYSRQLQVQDLPSGIYFLRTLDVNGGELQQQMAIQR